MAWNPEPEVAVARDAAKKLNAPMCVVLWVTEGATHIGVASYGKTKNLCEAAARLGEHLFKAADTWGEDETT